MAVASIDAQVRGVSDGEVAFFHDNGWATLPGLIAPELAAELLAHAKDLMGPEGDEHSKREGLDNSFGNAEFAQGVDADELFGRFGRSARLGENAARLFGRSSAVRRLDDRLMVKLGDERGGPSAAHQDHLDRPFDRTAIAFWIALDEVTPAMGSLQFFSGSQGLGLLGRWALPVDKARERFPWLNRYELSDPPHLQPGDATVHSSMTVHCAPANTAGRPRWAYRFSYFPADALFTGARSAYTDGLDLEPWQPLEHPAFPVIYEP